MVRMRAFRLLDWQRADFAEVDVPEPGPGEVRVRMAGVGLCHTDLHFLEAPAGAFPYDLPFTLGHENGGYVEALGPGVTGLAEGDAVVAAGVHSCGRCDLCLRGHDNYCPLGATGRGYGHDGGLADYLVVPARELVRLDALDPVTAAPLTDAGATSYHAVKKVLPKLTPGSTAVVVGAGGLGGYAVQYLRLLSAARVVAVDVAPQRLAFAREVGAHETLSSDDSTAGRLRELTRGAGAEAVFDFVGVDATMRLALGAARPLGSVAIVGAGGGTATVGWGALPLECDVWIPMGATIADLREVVALAEQGALRIEVETFPFERTAEAYERFARGELRSRAVVTLG
jgi:alcohol dehydrogenase, propanol-preferring